MPKPSETPDVELFSVVFENHPSPSDIASLAVGDADHVEIKFESGEIASDVIAALVDAVDRWLEAGRKVRLIEAPQMLAHTLYKVGRLNNASLSVSVRLDEPYAG